MKDVMILQRFSLKIPLLILICCSFLLINSTVRGQQAASNREISPAPVVERGELANNILFLPTVKVNSPWHSPFGTESNLPWLADSNITQRGIELKVGWTRMGTRVSWRSLQPEEGDSIDWSKLSEFEKEIKSLKAAGITPVVIINDSPSWATVEPTSCAAIRTDKFPAFENFVRKLVNRYKDSEFDVHAWELGNEPDVDPRMVRDNNVFGCWGDIEDKYYGGEHYGEMLKVIGPAIKETDPLSKVWFGGLLLASPNTTIPGLGKPELFLKGALEAGAGPYFDVLAYHWYPGYRQQKVDHDLLGYWESYGGGTIGKTKYLREMMAEYGISKPLVLNESNLMCVSTSKCDPPDDDFFEMQANHLVRSYVRGLSEGVTGISVYTLNGPGWRHTGILDEAGNPRPAYSAYKELIRQLDRTRYSKKVDVFIGVEAYAFISGNQEVMVAWSYEDFQSTVAIPKQKFVKAISRSGTPINANLVGENYEITVGFEPVYIVLLQN
jgi:hypothetical protein